MRAHWTRLRRILGAVRRGARTVLDKEPLTLLGLLLLGGAAVAVLHFGRERQDLVLYVAGLAVGGLALLLVALVTLVAVVLRLGWRPPASLPERVEAQVRETTGFSLPSLGWLPFVSLRWEWLEPAGVEVETEISGGRMREVATHRERGEQPRTVRRVLVEDVFGVARLGLRLVQPARRLVLPGRGRPLSSPVLEAMAGGDNISHPKGPPEGDLIEMRRYVQGDPIKRVLWKTFARSRTLMVRLPERAYTPTKKTLAYLVCGEGDEPSSGIARMALEAQAFGADWRFGADGGDEPTRSVEDALLQIVRSRAARDRQGAGLAHFLERGAEQGAFRCVLFVPPRPGPWLERVEREIRRHPGTVEAIVGTDGLEEDRRGRRWTRLLVADAEAPLEERARTADAEAVMRRLAAAGARVTLVDRVTGRAYLRRGRRAA